MLRGPDTPVLQLMATHFKLLLTEVIINWTQLCVRSYCPQFSFPLLETPKRDCVQHVCVMAQALSYSEEGHTGGYGRSFIRTHEFGLGPWPLTTPNPSQGTRGRAGFLNRYQP